MPPIPPPRFVISSVVIAIFLGLVARGGAEESTAQEAAALSPRNANYTLEARLDPAARTIEGRQVLEWRNLQATPTAELPFHLYWNAWRNDHSVWLREDRLRGRSDNEDPRPEDWAYLVVDEARLADGTELPRRYATPEPGGSADRTVLVLDLPTPVGPGETVTVELRWRAKIPRTFARTGARGDFFFIAHWFPKLGVYEPEGWNCRPFHANTEFYSDYGVYDVTLTLPERFVVGATGELADERENSDGTQSWRFVEQDVHGFAWTASPDYVEKRQRFEAEGLPPVEMRLLMQPEHLHQAERHFRATRAALELYGKWYGPYPYGHVTIVDPAWGSGAGGMEYPTIFTAGTRLSRPFGGGSPEGVTIHEAGHQFWYGMVGNNEFDYAWLDEGLNTFSTARVAAETYGEWLYDRSYLDPPGTELGGFITVLFPGVRQSRAMYGNGWVRFLSTDAATAGPIAEPAYRYYPPTASRLSYQKTATWLLTLERHLGWDVLQRILSTFFERYAFAHPRPEDFLAVASEVSGQDLSWFFDQVIGSSVGFDYAVDSVESLAAAPTGLVEEGGEMVYTEPETTSEGEPARYRNEVAVRRHGGGIFPVEVLMVFEDGREKRFAWKGKERWKLFVEEGPARLDYAVVDPERVLMLDVDYRNNSRRRESKAAAPARRWAAKWAVWLQEYLHAFSFFL